MTRTNINTQASYETVVETLLTLPQEMTGDSRVVQQALEKCGITLLALIRDSFVVKSMGATDEAGDRWAPLQPSTVENRARRRGQRKTSKSKRRKGENSEIYDRAVRRAKSIIKNQNLKYDKYARRDTAILLDSGSLLKSLTPNSGSPDQILEVSNGGFSVGTRRKGAAAHHYGTSKLPQRRLWPYPQNFPDRWWDLILKGVQEGMVESIRELIRGAL